MGAEQTNSRREDPPCLRMALAMLALGLRPVPIHPGQKKPIGDGWGLRHHTEESLRAMFRGFPGAGVGIVLGDDGTGNGIIDMEIDDPDLADDAMDRMFPAGPPDTLRFRSTRGMHYLFRYDIRMAGYGQTIIKGEVDENGVVSGNPDYVGLEFRVGTINPLQPVQEQTILPPTPMDNGAPRQWIGPGGTLLLPEAAFEDRDRILPIPESIFADLDEHAQAQVDPKPRKSRLTSPIPIPPPQWDVEDVKEAILPHALTLAKEWGLEITGKKASSKGFWECRAIGREDKHPSAGFNEETGVYLDLGTKAKPLSLFQLAEALEAYPDINAAINGLGERFGVKPASGEVSGNKVKKVKSSPLVEKQEWEPPHLRYPIQAEPFPLEVLPESLRQLCEDGAESMQCPVDYFAVAALALAGAAMGLSVSLELTSTWEEFPALYVAIVGPPGSKKTPAIRMMARPLYAIDRRLRDNYLKAHQIYQAALQAYEADRKRGMAEEAPVPPIRAHLTLDDATKEALALIHSENPRGVVLILDELTAWVASLNAYRAGRGDDKQFWLRCNSGSLVKVDRKGSRESILIPHPCISVVGGLTPGMLPAIRDDRRDDGWVDRILFCYPEPRAEPRVWSEKQVGEDHLLDWGAAIERLWACPMDDRVDGRKLPHFVRMTEEAKAEWVRWFNDHSAEVAAPDFPRKSLEGPWSKLEGFTARLLLILSRIRQVYEGKSINQFHDNNKIDSPPPQSIQVGDVQSVRLLSNYFKSHFRRARMELNRKRELATDEVESVLRWISRHSIRIFSGREILRQFPRFDDRDREDVLQWLLSRNIIRETPTQPRLPGQPGRRPAAQFEVNPLYGDHLTKSILLPESEDSSIESILSNGRHKREAEEEPKPVPSPQILTWLVGFLLDGPDLQSRVVEAAAQMGYALADLERAVPILGIARSFADGVESWRLAAK